MPPRTRTSSAFWHVPSLGVLGSLLVSLACGIGPSGRMRGSEAGPLPDPPPAPSTARAEPSGKGPPDPTVAEVKTKAERIAARHVLIQWVGSEKAEKTVTRTREQAHALAEEIVKRARAGEDLGRLASEFSDEPGAAARGGALGWFGRGQMVRAFEDAAFALEPGQISEIIETRFGYHVIERTQ